MKGQIVEYKGDVDILYYELYFCDEDGNFLDYSRMTFTGDSFIFNGLLASGQVIEEDVSGMCRAVLNRTATA